MNARAFIFFLAAGLAWCSAMPAGAQPLQACPMIYQPVCGVVVSAREIATYANSCRADQERAAILHDGKCQGADTAKCPRDIVQPVCARKLKSGIETTYDSLCRAEKDWAVLAHKGRC
ncbi:MAG TPA: hypothetical protein VHX61_16465 [Rhizomicrobium sp.]|jgi:hypothetical protein|nr:hypothetical protein [Rhizomicrobium sp.]